MSSPSGKCFCTSQAVREYDYKKTIKRMTEALGKELEKKRKKFW